MPIYFRSTSVWPAAFLALLLAACGGGSGGNDSPPPALGAAAALGAKIFSDASLSVSGQMSCATCHEPSAAHATNNPDLVVPAGGATLETHGFRNAPSLRYLNLTPAFFFDGEGTPTGGFNRDGRASSLLAQAERPFLAPHEMANATSADVIAKLRLAPYADEFRKVFGAGIFDTPDAAFDRVRFALAQYQMEDADFHRFDSKYDAFLAGRASLTGREIQGLALFNNPAKGNCAACHPSARGADGSPPLFTDFTYDNIGVPRNASIPANADTSYFDLGLCGPLRTDLADRDDLCGAFKVPTLRNVAVSAPYFHNGRFRTLKEAVGFYVRRDTHPEEWYPLDKDGIVRKFDDLPLRYRRNVNTTEAPYNRGQGDAPALTPEEVDLVVEFLGTLTDGYRP
ncbi:MAG TPA: cytochrome c peroxidase [Casimicrobiaceae bacterium]|nr:cytochrome c peroxidase [Casimicrobiaceae bacterium]